MDEAEVVRKVAEWLTNDGWTILRADRRGRGLDIEAERNSQHWFIEAKGDSAGDQGNQFTNFHSALGQICENRNDAHAKYSIALPDIPYYRRLWNNPPATGRLVTCLFVPSNGNPAESF